MLFHPRSFLAAVSPLASGCKARQLSDLDGTNVNRAANCKALAGHWVTLSTPTNTNLLSTQYQLSGRQLARCEAVDAPLMTESLPWTKASLLVAEPSARSMISKVYPIYDSDAMRVICSEPRTPKGCTTLNTTSDVTATPGCVQHQAAALLLHKQQAGSSTDLPQQRPKVSIKSKPSLFQLAFKLRMESYNGGLHASTAWQCWPWACQVLLDAVFIHGSKTRYVL